MAEEERGSAQPESVPAQGRVAESLHGKLMAIGAGIGKGMTSVPPSLLARSSGLLLDLFPHGHLSNQMAVSHHPFRVALEEREEDENGFGTRHR